MELLVIQLILNFIFCPKIICSRQILKIMLSGAELGFSLTEKIWADINSWQRFAIRLVQLTAMSSANTEIEIEQDFIFRIKILF